ncbi:tetratricopeptide repeat protein [Tellurirhabdus rosea]|uniref:tetratricopeptide repeat protein n=1 Tax=Tellurirhabdus rosea TaxID=2674997 RepID=UPI002256C89D|nr:tetratricopeptide repeat protein [Tellurirhabdus rosea]
MKALVGVLLGTLLAVSASAQIYDPREFDKKYDMLLKHPGVQIESAEAINNLYNYKFYEADKEFRWLRLRYPNHPMPYFLMGLAEWWKIVPNTDVTDYDDKCLAYMDSTITKAEKLYDEKDDKVEASFFLSAAYAFKGRLYSERKKWAKATLAGKNALKYFDKCKGNGDLSPELLFGDGLFNYYAQWIPQNYPLLKPILVFFPKGNKQQGIQQLEKTSNNAFYTRTEARYFLLQIYSMENQYDKAYDLAKYMWQQYPDNPFFERYYARTAFVRGQIAEAESSSRSILNKISESRAGYEAVSGRTAAYILAYINYNYYRNLPVAKQFYQQSIDFAKQTNSFDAGYYWASVLALGKIATAEKNYEQANAYFKEVLDKADKKSSQYKEAKEAMKNTKKSRREERRKRN